MQKRQLKDLAVISTKFSAVVFLFGLGIYFFLYLRFHDTPLGKNVGFIDLFFTPFIASIAVSFIVFSPLVVVSTRARGADPFRFSRRYLAYFQIPRDYQFEKYLKDLGDYEIQPENDSKNIKLLWRCELKQSGGQRFASFSEGGGEDRLVAIEFLEGMTLDFVRIVIAIQPAMKFRLYDTGGFNVEVLKDLKKKLRLEEFTISVDQEGNPLF